MTRTCLVTPPLDRLGLWGLRMEDEQRLNRLTPRERDVYEVSQRHPDWSKAQIGREVYLPPHVVRRYLQNIREKLGDQREREES
jgi:DNA-binding CsgD family transcriptional regulator